MSTIRKTIPVVVLMLLLALMALPAAAQDGGQNSITVTGYGQASGAPDVAYIELGVEVADASVAQAFTQASGTIERIIAALRDLGIAAEDIRTSSLNIWAESRYGPMGETVGISSYRVNSILSVTVRDITIVERVITTAVDAGANVIYGLNFGISDTEALMQEARAAAVENARATAESLAGLLNVEVGDVVMVVEGFGGYSPIMGFRGGGGGAMEAAMPIQPGQFSVGVTVTVTYSIAGR